MEEKSKIKIVAGVDIIVTILMLFIGVLVIYLGLYYNDYITSISSGYLNSQSPMSWITKTPLIVLVTGLTILLYGIKRLIDDLLKIA